jgi:hypothetical protein
MEIWEPKALGTLWATLGLLRETFTFFLPSGSKMEKGEHGLWLETACKKFSPA